MFFPSLQVFVCVLQKFFICLGSYLILRFWFVFFYLIWRNVYNVIKNLAKHILKFCLIVLYMNYHNDFILRFNFNLAHSPQFRSE